MHRFIPRFVLPAAGLFALAGSTYAGAESIAWTKTFDSALALAKSSNKLIMADFYTDW